MTIRFDEKGKFFTNVISKETVWTIIQTHAHRIEGYMYVRPGERIKDELNRADTFLAVTDAVIFSTTGEELYRCEFLSINRNHIIWLMPFDRMPGEVDEDDLLEDDAEEAGFDEPDFADGTAQAGLDQVNLNGGSSEDDLLGEDSGGEA